MNASQAYGELRAFGQPVIETREAAALLRTSSSNASHLLSALAAAGLSRRFRHGMWALDPDLDPVVAAPYLTSPFPAYVSLWSALAAHDMIEQIPAQIFLVSLARTREVTTGLGLYSIHHIDPALFGGFEGDAEHGYVASAEKALFDTVYIRAPRGGRAYFPELVLPASFDTSRLDEWTERIPSGRLRTLVARDIHGALLQARNDASR